MAHLSLREFEQLVLGALDGLPLFIRQRMDNVDVVVGQWPRLDDLEEAGLDDPRDLLGLYQGVPLTKRTNYDMTIPDKITIFQRPIEAACATRAEIVNEVRVTVIHEVAHHFGLSDAALDETQYG